MHRIIKEYVPRPRTTTTPAVGAVGASGDIEVTTVVLQIHDTRWRFCQEERYWWRIDLWWPIRWYVSSQCCDILLLVLPTRLYLSDTMICCLALSCLVLPCLVLPV
jgi:hypothetical protein